MQKVIPFLWFDDQAEEAASFYVSIFRNAKISSVARYGDGGPRPKGTVMTVTFEIEGEEFTALNGGPEFTFSPAISFFVNCADQGEVDELWEKLTAGGEPGQCGWLVDKFGLSWQIIPKALIELLNDPDLVKSQRVMSAMLQMKKIDVAALERAHDGD